MAVIAASPNLNPALKFSSSSPSRYHRHRHHCNSSSNTRLAAGGPVMMIMVGRRNALAPPVLVLQPKSRRHSASLLLLTRASSADDDVASFNPSTTPDAAAAPRSEQLRFWDSESRDGGNPRPGDGYVGLFVRMLGLDNDPLDREQAVITLWKYSQGGKHCIDAIMQFPGCINLTINLLKSDSDSACEAAAGLLRIISSVNLYRSSVAEGGAIEEVAGLLCRSDLTAEVKEQSICTLWNLSVDEGLRVKIARSDLLPLLVKFLDDEEIRVKEAAGGVLENLGLSHCNHGIMVEAGVIPKLAEILKSNAEGYKVIRKEAKNALLELSRDEYHKILIIEEGLILVPIIGAAAYKSFRPVLHSWPSLPDGTEIERTSSSSRYGASELLLGLSVREKRISLEEAKIHAVVGRSQQQFLARIGAIELDEERNSPLTSLTIEQQTILPWMDGVARLVLILGLEDASAITRAAHAIADASINEHMRIAFKEAGALRLLVQLLGHSDDALRDAVIHVLDRLSVSHEVSQVIEVERILKPFISILKDTERSESLKEKIMNILARIFDPGRDMKVKFHDKLVNGSYKVSKTSSQEGGCSEETPDLLSKPKVIAREAIDSSIISCLIENLKSASPNIQKSAASVLEYFANFEEYLTAIIGAGIESGLAAVFQPRFLYRLRNDVDYQQELNAIEAEESGLAIAAASRLLSKLLNFEQFCHSIDTKQFMTLLRKILRSDIHLHTKDWVAACLVKMESLVDSSEDFEHPIDMEVTVYDTIPRLVEQMRMSFTSESREAAVVELNEIISKGVAECTRAVAAAGGIFPLVILIEEGSVSAVEASLAILYNLSMDSENHSAIVAAGAVPVLRRIILTEGPHWTRALHLLRTLPT